MIETGTNSVTVFFSMGKWHDHLLAVEGPPCRCTPDGVHPLEEMDNHGYYTGFLYCPFCDDAITDIPGGMEDETDTKGWPPPEFFADNSGRA